MELPLSAEAAAAAALSGAAADDVSLLQRAARDRQAFALLYRQHYGLVANYILRRVGDPHLTEDLVADVFFAALRNLPRFQYRGLPIKAWLYRIAANRVNRWVRRERRKLVASLATLEAAWRGARTPGGEWAGGAVSGSAYPAADAHRRAGDEPAAGAESNIDRERVRLVLLTLPPRYQTVLTLHYFEGLSLEEIAASVGCRLGTVKSRLARGRTQLRQQLRQEGSR